jgi:hypothetical protein
MPYAATLLYVSSFILPAAQNWLESGFRVGLNIASVKFFFFVVRRYLLNNASLGNGKSLGRYRLADGSEAIFVEYRPGGATLFVTREAKLAWLPQVLKLPHIVLIIYGGLAKLALGAQPGRGPRADGLRLLADSGFQRTEDLRSRLVYVYISTSIEKQNSRLVQEYNLQFMATQAELDWLRKHERSVDLALSALPYPQNGDTI